MDGFTFISEIVKAIAWPSAVIGLVFLLRKPIVELVPYTIATVMQELNLKARNGKAFRYSRFSHANYHVSDNVLNRKFMATAPNQK